MAEARGVRPGLRLVGTMIRMHPGPFAVAVTGAALFAGLKAELVSHTNLWRLVIGLGIIALVLLFPRGIVGSLTRGRS